MPDFSDFQLEEYKNISQAHFKTNEMIVAFFRYYLLLMAIPLSTLSATFISSKLEEQVRFLLSWQTPTGIFFISVAIIGFFLMCYITGLRLEALLYARTVNSVRKYFKETFNYSGNLVLPTDPKKPNFKKPGDHISIVLSFALFNSLYVAMGTTIFVLDPAKLAGSPAEIVLRAFGACSVTVAVMLSLALHITAHFYLCFRRDKRGIE